jgi:hypothetical protein
MTFFPPENILSFSSDGQEYLRRSVPAEDECEGAAGLIVVFPSAPLKVRAFAHSFPLDG